MVLVYRFISFGGFFSLFGTNFLLNLGKMATVPLLKGSKALIYANFDGDMENESFSFNYLFLPFQKFFSINPPYSSFEF